MTPEAIKLVQETWAAVEPIADTAADLFYGKLFELDPLLKSLFPDEMAEQKKKLMQTLAVCVKGLTDLNSIVPAVQALGRRHVEYKVEPEQYTTVGQALLWTLEQGLGEVYTPEVANAWTEVYDVLSTTMIAAADEVPALA